jgi:hypothetical protein
LVRAALILGALLLVLQAASVYLRTGPGRSLFFNQGSRQDLTRGAHGDLIASDDGLMLKAGLPAAALCAALYLLARRFVAPRLSIGATAVFAFGTQIFSTLSRTYSHQGAGMWDWRHPRFLAGLQPDPRKVQV